MTPAQCRAARALLSLHQTDLADLAGVAASTLIDFENERRAPRGATISAIRRALEDAGVIFLEGDGGGEGVRRRRVGRDGSAD